MGCTIENRAPSGHPLRTLTSPGVDRRLARAPKRQSRQPGQIAQSVEQGIENPRVGGSIPSLPTTQNRNTKADHSRSAFVVLKRSLGEQAGRRTGVGVGLHHHRDPCVGQDLTACHHGRSFGHVDTADAGLGRE
jgi:hypothetical protein